MTENIKYLNTVAEGIKDKFLTLCFGALFMSIFYIFMKDSVNSFIIIQDFHLFTYLAVLIILLSATAVAHVLGILYKLFLKYIINLTVFIEAYCSCKFMSLYFSDQQLMWIFRSGLNNDRVRFEGKEASVYIKTKSEIEYLKSKGFISNYSDNSISYNYQLDFEINLPQAWDWQKKVFFMNCLKTKIEKIEKAKKNDHE